MTDLGARRTRKASSASLIALFVLVLVMIGLTAFTLYRDGIRTWPELAGLAIVAALVEAGIVIFMLPVILIAPKGAISVIDDYGAPRSRPVGAFTLSAYVGLLILMLFMRGVMHVLILGPPLGSWRPEQWADDWPTALSYYVARYGWITAFTGVAFVLGYAWTVYVHLRRRREARNRPHPLSLEGG